MTDNLSEWTTLLDGHEARLQALSTVLAEEKDALLANDLIRLHDVTTRKITATAALESSQKSLVSQLQNSPGTPSGLKSLIDALPGEMKKILSPKRKKIAGLATTIARQNAFNADCLTTYNDHIGRLSRMFASLIGGTQTYGASGKSPEDSSGRLISRSL